MYWVGPDALLNWDRLPAVALYRGHMKNMIAGTSNGGATTHAFGYKVDGGGSFGKDGDGNSTPPTDRAIRSLSGFRGSIMREAQNGGMPAGIVNDGHIGEPGTACFLTEVGNRNNWDEISRQLILGRPGSKDRDPQVILGGGEENFLPAGTVGMHGPGKRTDGTDLIAIARAKGYVVLRNRREFDAFRKELGSRKAWIPKVLGLFAAKHTFNDRDEEDLIARGMVRGSTPKSLILFGGMPGSPSFDPPTIAEMTTVALEILDRASRAVGRPFFLVVEPESCDNFGNSGNAIGTLTALKRSDDALGVLLGFIAKRPKTTVLTAADSDANGLQVVTMREKGPVGTTPGNPATGEPEVSVPLDGVLGRGTEAFLSAPDARGVRLPFAIAWAADSDVSGGIVSRSAGQHAGLLHSRFSGRFDNTDVYRFLYACLFGKMLPPAKGAAPRR